MSKTELLMVDGGTNTLDLTKATIVRDNASRFHDGIRIQEIHLYIDHKDKEERQVFKVVHRSTLGNRKPRWGSDTIELTTIYGYNPDKNVWGPSERRSDMEIEWKNGKRLIKEILEFAQAELVQRRPGESYYRRTQA